MLAIILLTIGFFSRLMIHIPDFTPVMGVALLSGIYLNKRYAILLPVALLMISDIFLGLHNTMIFTWSSVALIAVFGLWVKKHKSFKMVLGSSVLAAVFFFLVTNFGVWLVSGMYPHTMKGLSNCFVLAIPFFRNELISTVAYSVLIYSAYELAAVRLKQTRFATVL